ncbi:MAG TPA: hypothetical protein VNS32_10585 [Flavisolibacter sp.]|nr:hypothetical protein [Flavisolibacter sp.]
MDLPQIYNVTRKWLSFYDYMTTIVDEKAENLDLAGLSGFTG